MAHDAQPSAGGGANDPRGGWPADDGPGSAAPAGTYDPSLITELGHDVFQIDTRMAGWDGVTAGYLIRSSRPCLVETGAGPSAPLVRAALAALGVGPNDLATVVVTHIHLDHAGGTGDISAMFPRARVVVHEEGARHLADPSRLMRSARRVYGAELDRLFGELAPTPAARIRSVGETGSVDLGDGRRLNSFHSPGHARHHLGLFDSASGDLYVGDAAGVFIPATQDLRPATPPPDFDLDTALASLRKFRDLQPRRLLFSHFGPVGAVAETLARSAEELRVWTEEVRHAHGRGLDLDHAVALVHERTKSRYGLFSAETDPTVAAKFNQVTGDAPNVAGIMRWLDQQRPQSS